MYHRGAKSTSAAAWRSFTRPVVPCDDPRRNASFLRDLLGRIVNRRAQITSDGYPGYPTAMEPTFGYEVDYAQIVKRYAPDSTEQDAATTMRGGSTPWTPRHG